MSTSNQRSRVSFLRGGNTSSDVSDVPIEQQPCGIYFFFFGNEIFTFSRKRTYTHTRRTKVTMHTGTQTKLQRETIKNSHAIHALFVGTYFYFLFFFKHIFYIFLHLYYLEIFPKITPARATCLCPVTRKSCAYFPRIVLVRIKYKTKRISTRKYTGIADPRSLIIWADTTILRRNKLLADGRNYYGHFD